MEIYCSRPSCGQPRNVFSDLNATSLKTVDATQKNCKSCGMPLILDGRYILEKPLARGGFGVTYLARDRRTPAMRYCVVKQLLPQGLDAQQMEIAKQLFEREGAVLEQLGSHPQIPTLLAFFELNVDGKSFFYLVQEFIDGYTLESLVQEFGSLPEADVIGILHQLLPVLQFIHDRHAIHRDIKPANIMINSTSQEHYLLDFGAVKQITYNTDLRGKARKSTSIFTMGYAAPEQMRGDTVFPATDIFALGSTCIYLLTGKHPGDLTDARSNTIQWRSYAPSVSNHFAGIIDRMLAHALQERYSSAQEVLRALPAPSNSGISNISTTYSQGKTSSKPLSVLQNILKMPVRSIVTNGFILGFELGLAIGLFQTKSLGGYIFSLLILLGIIPSALFLRSKQILDSKDLLVFGNAGSLILVLLSNLFFQIGINWLLLLSLTVTSVSATIAFLLLFRFIYLILEEF